LIDGYVIVAAITLASIYGLLAIGISIVWSSLGMLNMAFGFTFAAAGYGAWFAAQQFPDSAAAVLAGGILTGALVGAAVCAVAFLPLHDKPNFTVRSLVATLAISLLGTQALLATFGPRVKPLPKIFGLKAFEITEDVVVTADKLGAVVSSVVLLLLVLAWMKTSRRGLEIRAMMQNPEGAVLSGISVRWTALPVTMLTGALAGLAAVLLSQTIFVSPTSGAMPLIKGLTIALLGGLGSVPGAVAGAVIIGFLEAAIGAVPFLGQRFVLMGTFLFIIIVLIIRPRGIGGLLDETRK
jgi:branched-chain amino acid transport system permease protein